MKKLCICADPENCKEIPENMICKRTASRGLLYLLKEEWSMGNGQCPACHQIPRIWRGHPSYLVGHKADCGLAAAITELGGEPCMKSEEHEQVLRS